MGIITRDEHGDPKWMWRSKISAVSVADAELQAVCLALRLAKLKNLNRFWVEGDNKKIMVSLASKKKCPYWPLIPLFKSVLEVSSFFISVSF